MKVIAKCRIRHNGRWYAAGDTMDLTELEIAEFGDSVSVPEFVSEVFPPEPVNTDVPKRGRRRKNAE